MGVKKGYKLTEVGVIPEDWEVKPLRDGLSEAPTYGINAPARAYGKGLAAYIRITDITDEGMYAPPEQMYVDTTATKKFFLQKGDIVFARTGASVGKSYLYRECDGELVYAGFLIKVHPDDLTFVAPYIFYYAHTEQYWDWVTKTSMRSGQPGINGAEYGGLLLPCPQMAEQTAIAAALSDVDALLASLDALIAKKRDMKQAAMQELLTGRKRLPGFGEEWGNIPISKIGVIKSGGTPSTSKANFWNGGIPWCTPTDITSLKGRKYITNTEKNISSLGISSSAAELLPPYSLIMTSRATICECAINTVHMATNQGFKNIIPNGKCDIDFLYYVMLMQKEALTSLSSGSTFLEFNKHQLSSYEICIPKDKAEQTAIASVLSDMDAEIATLEARRAKTQALKQGMMQDLLTGRIRLKPAHGDPHA